MWTKLIVLIQPPMYWIPKLALIILCLIHDKTKYHTARSIQELFYWPEGFCMDMVVVAAFFIIAAISLYGDFKFLRRSKSWKRTQQRN